MVGGRMLGVCLYGRYQERMGVFWQGVFSENQWGVNRQYTVNERQFVRIIA